MILEKNSDGSIITTINNLESEINYFMKKCLAELPKEFGEEIRGLFQNIIYEACIIKK